MEAHSSQGYSIAGGKIPILITLKKTSDLNPHEETVAEDLAKLVNALQENPVLRHPIIADRRTGIILDGTHRLAAIKQLKCNFIPSALVEYDDPKIIIERWFRRLSASNLQSLETDLELLNPREVSIEECEEGLSKRRWCATVENPKSHLAFPARSRDPYQMVQDSHTIEIVARNQGAVITYQDTKDMETRDSESLVMSTIKLEKNEVINAVKKGKLFPPKSTRHLVPSRPLGGGVPLDWLRGPDFSRAQSRYQEFIQSRKVKRLPEGSRVGSRRYLEEVFLFE